jgi:hypothetical protein
MWLEKIKPKHDWKFLIFFGILWFLISILKLYEHFPASFTFRLPIVCLFYWVWFEIKLGKFSNKSKFLEM